MKSEKERPITIEDLLRLKRAERPPAEFWTTFDRQLRAKQLSALVGKRPWWQRLPQVLPNLFRYRIPLGASAVLALSIVSIRYHQSSPVASAPRPNAPVIEQQIVASAPLPAIAVVSSPIAVNELPRRENLTLAAPEAPAQAVAVAMPSAPEPLLVAEVAAPLVGGLKLDEDTALPSPAARNIAANLAVLRSSETAITRTLLAQNTGFEVRSAAIRTPVEPLQQITPPGDSRRSRFLTAMVATATPGDSYRSTERAANRIVDERLYDQIHRFDARGDRLQLKF